MIVPFSRSANSSLAFFKPRTVLNSYGNIVFYHCITIDVNRGQLISCKNFETLRINQTYTRYSEEQRFLDNTISSGVYFSDKSYLL